MDANHTGEIVTLSDTAKTAVEAAQALGIKVGQVACQSVLVYQAIQTQHH